MLRLLYPPLLAGITASLLAFSALAGQETPGPDGDRFWWDAGIGVTSMQMRCGLCTGDIDAGPSLDLAGGAWASPHLAVGIELGGWLHDDDGVRERTLRAGLTGRWSPKLASGFHVVGGLGWMGYRAEEFHYGTLNLQMGVGWVLPITEGWAVGNRLVFDTAPFGTLKNDGVPVAGGIRMGALRFSVFAGPR